MNRFYLSCGVAKLLNCLCKLFARCFAGIKFKVDGLGIKVGLIVFDPFFERKIGIALLFAILAMHICNKGYLDVFAPFFCAKAFTDNTISKAIIKIVILVFISSVINYFQSVYLKPK